VSFVIGVVVAVWLTIPGLALAQPNEAVGTSDQAGADTSTAKPTGKRWVAIDKFENKTGASDDLFQNLRSRITNEIINTRKFDVVEREQIKSVMSEVNLQQQGLTNPAESPDSPTEGKMKAAGFVIYGSVLHLGLDGASGTVGDVTASRANARVEIQLRIANAEDGKILSSKEVISTASQSGVGSSGTTSGGNFADQLIESSIRTAASDVVGELMALAYPIRVIAVGADNITINLAQEQSAIGKRFKVYSEGEELVDPDTGDSLGKDEKCLGEVVVAEVKPKVSICTLKGSLKADTLEKGMLLRSVSAAEKAQESAKEKAERTKSFESRF
jgi:curli biogenesis system outer membrane secretion channel CsgG